MSSTDLPIFSGRSVYFKDFEGLIVLETLTKNSIYEAMVSGYTSEGLGVCRVDGRAVFVQGVIEGELVRIKLVKVSSGACYGRALEILQPSPARISPDCGVYGKCGGCGLRHMSYEEELRFKLGKVNDAFRHIGGLDFECSGIIGAEETGGYRNKAIYSIAADAEGRPCFGFYRQRSHDVIAVKECALQSDLSSRAASAVTAFMEKYSVSAYDEATGKGTVRHVFVRTAKHGRDAVLVITAARGFGGLTDKLVNYLRTACPELTGIVLNINKSAGNTVLSGEFYTLHGSGIMRDSICGYEYSISPLAFFQINPVQTEKLYMQALDYAAPDRCGVALDLYCGAGTISLLLSSRAEKVIGGEIVPEAVENARANAISNNVTNTEFYCGDAGEVAKMLAEKGIKPEVIVTDPPRKGLSEEAIAASVKMSPERIVYVSCNPATLARDLRIFSDSGYNPVEATAVDMFPRTSHVETVVLMSHSKS